MDPTQFDRIATLFPQRRLSRRRALQQLGATGLAAGLLGAVGVETTAAAPPTGATVAVPLAIYRSVDTGALAITPAVTEASKPAAFMFVQSFEGGSLVPQPGQAGHYTLTLPHGLGETIYFSDRPERLVGIAPTPQFLKGLGFSAANPPNAVLIGHQSPTHEDLVVLELFNPRYDTTTNTATYDVQVLKDTHKVDLVFTQTPDEEAGVARTYTDAHLFIDDCPDRTAACVANVDPTQCLGGNIGVGMCWSWATFSCAQICGGHDYNALCNDTYPACGGLCNAQLQGPGSTFRDCGANGGPPCGEWCQP